MHKIFFNHLAEAFGQRPLSYVPWKLKDKTEISKDPSGTLDKWREYFADIFPILGMQIKYFL